MASRTDRPRWALALHGGAGTIRRPELTAAVEEEYRAALDRALDAGIAVLDGGGGALDAVEAVVVTLEDDPLFNAGRGAVLTADGRHELDASIMDGRSRGAGAVAGVRRVRNPVHLARLVMERSPHVLLVGEGAEAFASEQGVTLVDPGWFSTARRRAQLAATRRELGTDATARSEDTALDEAGTDRGPDDGTMGTVGAVALDAGGHLAAATSTGGLTNKRPGRVGDSPVIGAGTYADDRTCAVSTTGTGELFLRAVAAYDVAARMRYGGQALAEAAAGTIMESVAGLGSTGGGGLIAVDGQGSVAMPFSSEGMYRACAVAGGERRVGIFRP
jgi:L-asparaginase / beta-aspartyl-peptidase